jgi:TfoX/Sxy family transcriptional regulator of competence genes
MASNASLVAFVVEQLGSDVTSKKMFGEYGIYRESQLIALFCDDQLFMKSTEAGRALLGEVDEAPPYPGAKPAFRIGDERWDDAAFMSKLASRTAAELAARPAKPKPAKPKPAKPKPAKPKPAKASAKLARAKAKKS